MAWFYYWDYHSHLVNVRKPGLSVNGGLAKASLGLFFVEFKRSGRNFFQSSLSENLSCARDLTPNLLISLTFLLYMEIYCQIELCFLIISGCDIFSKILRLPSSIKEFSFIAFCFTPPDISTLRPVLLRRSRPVSHISIVIQYIEPDSVIVPMSNF